MAHIWLSHIIYRNKSRTGWRILIGCLKLQVIFCKRATKYRALLRKMTYEDKAAYDSTPPCTKFRRNSKSCHKHMIGSWLGHVRTYVTWLIPYTCVTWLIHICDMTHTCVWCDTLIAHTCIHPQNFSNSPPIHSPQSSNSPHIRSHQSSNSPHINSPWSSNSPHMHSPHSSNSPHIHSHQSSNGPYIYSPQFSNSPHIHSP